eukprot:TRINITY_DN3868_c0_g1_i1.p1 TRINITY_DN3868_c0_g1~~TRINITY_DN3868_c0_g1_i1.p1  ORF type:complete len:105 (+),score=8.25 TRINITY_DN3868_c0_g1_i1:147-461(+)
MSEAVEDFSPEHMASNNRVLYYSRILISIIAGCATGIIGLTGYVGFLPYFITYAIICGLMWFKMNGKPLVYLQSETSLWWDGLFTGLLSYVLFWTLSYDIIHIY